MFEDHEKWQIHIDNIQKKTLEQLELKQAQCRHIFYNKSSARLNEYGFSLIQEKLTENIFYEIDIKTEYFRLSDLIKISKLNNELFYINRKKLKIYTCDKDFYYWCKIMDGHINGIRLAI